MLWIDHVQITSLCKILELPSFQLFLSKSSHTHMTSQKLNSWGPSTSQASADIPTSYKQKAHHCNYNFITCIHLDSLGNYTTTLQLPQLIKTDQQSNSTSISICASSILRYILEGEYDNTHSYILLISSSQVEAWSHVARVEGHSDRNARHINRNARHAQVPSHHCSCNPT